MNTSSHNDNCFDIIRHLAALAVIFSHHHEFNKMHAPSLSGFIDLGGASIAVFFAISGYLVTQSFDRSPNFTSFMEKRLRRIFPALIVCTLLMLYLFAPFYQENVLSYLTSEHTFSNALRLIALLPIEVPNVYHGYKYPSYINGSLWTLSMEFLCYLILAFLLSLHRSWKTPASLLAIIVVLGVFIPDEIKSSASWYGINLKWLIQLSLCFATGAILSLTKNIWSSSTSKITLLAIAIITTIATLGSKEVNIIGFIAIAIITIIIGASFKETLIKGRFDISYGLYIYAFPVQQVISNETNLGFFSGLALSIAITSILAYASWTLVEKRFMRKKRIAPPAQQHMNPIAAEGITVK